jgi:hypothetical protein
VHVSPPPVGRTVGSNCAERKPAALVLEQTLFKILARGKASLACFTLPNSVLPPYNTLL